MSDERPPTFSEEYVVPIAGHLVSLRRAGWYQRVPGDLGGVRGLVVPVTFGAGSVAFSYLG